MTFFNKIVDKTTKVIYWMAGTVLGLAALLTLGGTMMAFSFGFSEKITWDEIVTTFFVAVIAILLFKIEYNFGTAGNTYRIRRLLEDEADRRIGK